LFGGTRQQVTKEIETGITRLPGNCYFRLDKESRKVVLDNLKAQLSANRARMIAELRILANQLRRPPSLAEYLRETRYELGDIYKSSTSSWHALLSEASLCPPPSEADLLLASKFRFLLHVDSTRRLRINLNLLSEADRSSEDLSPLEKRMVEMLTFRLLQKEARQPECEWDAGLKRLRSSASAREELRELTEVLLDCVRLHAEETPVMDDCPLFLHRQYMRDEILVGMGLPDQVGARHTQTGRLWIPESNTEIFFVTIDKSEKTFSPSTRYEDFAVSANRFHWQSQSTTGEESPTGRRYVSQKLPPLQNVWVTDELTYVVARLCDS
jgi:hypothetical protein